MQSILLVLLLSATSQQPDLVIRDHVDLIELNHFYDENGRLVFDQFIFWNFDYKNSEYVIVAWRLRKNPKWHCLRDYRTNRYTTTFSDFKNRDVMRTITSYCYRESWTQYDPELVNREVLPQEQRRGLSKPRKLCQPNTNTSTSCP